MNDELNFKCKKCGYGAEDYNLVPIEVIINKNKIKSIATCPVCDTKHTMYKINNNWFNRLISKIVAIFTFRKRMNMTINELLDIIELQTKLILNNSIDISKLKEEIDLLKPKSSKKPKVNKESKSKKNKKK
jgi:hypothetical protein